MSFQKSESTNKAAYEAAKKAAYETHEAAKKEARENAKKVAHKLIEKAELDLVSVQISLIECSKEHYLDEMLKAVKILSSESDAAWAEAVKVKDAAYEEADKALKEALEEANAANNTNTKT